MGLSSDAFQKKLWVLDEADGAYGVFPDGLTTGISAADAIDLLTFSDTWTTEQNQDMRLNGSRSELERTEGRKVGTLSLKKNLFPNGTATLAPTDNKFLLVGIGTVTVSGNRIYSQIAKRCKSLSLYLEEGHFSEYYTGFVPSELVFEFSGATEDMFTISGPFSDKFANGTTSIASTVTAGATVFTLTVGHMCEVNTRWEIDTEIVLVTALNEAGTEATVTRAYQNTSAAGHTAGAVIAPVTPAHTVTGNKLTGTLGQLSIDGTIINFIDGSIRLNNGTTLFNDEVGTSTGTGYTDALRVEVGGTFNIRLYKAQFYLIPTIEKFIDMAITLTRGDQVGSRYAFTMPKCKGMAKEISKSETEAVFQLDFNALGSAGEDNLTVTQF